MSASEGFIEHLRDALSGLGPVSFKRMFGGAGIYADGIMFALISDDTLYLKADDATRGEFESEGLAAFAYQSRGRSIALSYWRAPERLLEEPDEMRAWALRALSAAKRSARQKASQQAFGRRA
jgi:DNA transformation protein